MLVNSSEKLIESLMGSSQVALNRRLTTERAMEKEREGAQKVTEKKDGAVLYLLRETKCYTSPIHILSNDFCEL